MLKKMSGASQKHAGDWPMTAPASERSCFSDFDRRSSCTSLFSRPGLFIGFGKGVAESDSSGSPKSPLDYRIFSGFGGHRVRSPRSPRAAGPRKIWNGDKVGLSLINEGECRSSGGDSGSSESRSILFVSQMRINIRNPKTSTDHHPLAEGSAGSSRSLPKNYAISFPRRIDSPDLRPDPSKKKGPELPGSRSASPLSVGAGGSIIAPGSLPITSGFADSLSASEIERSEDYTRIISRGANPKTTHIFGDCVLESPSGGDAPGFAGNDDRAEEGRESFWMVDCSGDPLPFPADDFLRICFSCKKKLDGEDIYIYRYAPLHGERQSLQPPHFLPPKSKRDRSKISLTESISSIKKKKNSSRQIRINLPRFNFRILSSFLRRSALPRSDSPRLLVSSRSAAGERSAGREVIPHPLVFFLLRRGEKAFCSCACRSREIGTEEEGEEEPANVRRGPPPPSRPEEVVPTGGDIAA